MLLTLLACRDDLPPEPVAATLLESRPEAPSGPVLAVGGDVNLGRRTNALVAENGAEWALAGVSQLATADLAYVNLECVVATDGDYRVDKGESGPYYYRARPELLAVLQAAGVDVVGTANNHVGDYGPPAVREQATWLDAAGLAHAGSGSDRARACAPTFAEAGQLVLAFYAVDATMPPYAASAERAGACYLDPSRPEDWASFAREAVAAVADRAHLAFLGVHWGDNGLREPSAQTRALARAAIGGGFDGILGSSAHFVHGVEIVDGRPVIYDAGNLLFDARGESESALFELTLAPSGVRQVRITALDAGYGRTTVARGEEGVTLTQLYADRSLALGTSLWAGTAELIVPLPELPARALPSRPERVARAGSPARPAEAPAAACVASEVPSDAQVADTAVGPLTLVGRRVGPARLSRRGMIDVETWWRVDKPLEKNVLLDVRATLEGGTAYWSGEHDGCDWTWPADRWTPGTIYHDRYALRPAPRPTPGAYTVSVGVSDTPLGAQRSPVEIGRFTLGKD